MGMIKLSRVLTDEVKIFDPYSTNLLIIKSFMSKIESDRIQIDLLNQIKHCYPFSDVIQEKKTKQREKGNEERRRDLRHNILFVILRYISWKH